MSDIYHAKRIYNYFKNYMAEENISQKFRLKNIDETRNCFIEEINQNDWMTAKTNKKKPMLLAKCAVCVSKRRSLSKSKKLVDY